MCPESLIYQLQKDGEMDPLDRIAEKMAEAHANTFIHSPGQSSQGPWSEMTQAQRITAMERMLFVMSAIYGINMEERDS